MSVFKKEIVQFKKLQMGVQSCRVIENLPRPLQNHFKYCRHTGEECARLATIEWKDAALKFSPTGEWNKMECKQVNVITEPARVVYMHKKLLGFFPFGAVDESIRGNGQLLIKLWNIFTMQQARGKEMDQAELVTILAETMLIPAYALQYYITWEEIDEHCVRGKIHYKGKSASGLFHFGQQGEILSFETMDRFYTDKNGHYKQMKWIARIDQYQERNNHRTPTAFSAIWKLAEGDHEYFKGMVAGITYAPFETYSVGTKSKPAIPRYTPNPTLAFP